VRPAVNSTPKSRAPPLKMNISDIQCTKQESLSVYIHNKILSSPQNFSATSGKQYNNE
jgi:hypothetical protein